MTDRGEDRAPSVAALYASKYVECGPYPPYTDLRHYAKKTWRHWFWGRICLRHALSWFEWREQVYASLVMNPHA